MKQFLSFEDTKKIIREKNLTSRREYSNFARIYNKNHIKRIPLTPDTFFKKIWKNWENFLDKKYLSFKSARKLCRNLYIESNIEYLKLYDKGKITKKLPKRIHAYYSSNSDWKNYHDFFGYDKKTKNYWNYEKAKEFLKKLNLKNQKEFFKAKRKGIIPKEIPSNPSRYYGAKN